MRVMTRMARVGAVGTMIRRDDMARRDRSQYELGRAGLDFFLLGCLRRRRGLEFRFSWRLTADCQQQRCGCRERSDFLQKVFRVHGYPLFLVSLFFSVPACALKTFVPFQSFLSTLYQFARQPSSLMRPQRRHRCRDCTKAAQGNSA